MMVLNLCKKSCPEKINFNLDTRLGDGADGEVFSLKDETSQVIKLGVLFEYPNEDIHIKYKHIESILEWIKDNNPPLYASVYKYNYLGTYSRSNISNEIEQKYILYYYTMQRLYKISEDEKKVFHSIVCHEDRNIKKNFSIFKIKKMLQGMSTALDFNFKKIIMFCESLQLSSLVHNDLHVRNIMKDQDGNFKLIDFERCTLNNYEKAANS